MSFRHTLAGRLMADPMAVVALIIITALVAIAVFADVISPHDHTAMNLADRFAPPSST